MDILWLYHCVFFKFTVVWLLTTSLLLIFTGQGKKQWLYSHIFNLAYILYAKWPCMNNGNQQVTVKWHPSYHSFIKTLCVWADKIESPIAGLLMPPKPKPPVPYYGYYKLESKYPFSCTYQSRCPCRCTCTLYIQSPWYYVCMCACIMSCNYIHAMVKWVIYIICD